MNWTGIVTVGVLIGMIAGGVGVATAVPPAEHPGGPHTENPACNSPSQGFDRSTAASDGTSIQRAGPGLVNARTKIGCRDVIPS